MSQHPAPWIAQERYPDIWKVVDSNDRLIADDLREDAARFIAAAPGMFIALVTAHELVETFLVAGSPNESTRMRLEVIEKVLSNGLEDFERRDKEHG